MRALAAMSGSESPGKAHALQHQIQRNKELARERLRLNRLAHSDTSPGSFGSECVPSPALNSELNELHQSEITPIYWLCGNILDSGSVCGSTCDHRIKEHFGETVCYRCKSKTNEYEYISKETIKREYLLTEGEIKSLQHISRPNKINPRWADIKLFLRKHCIDYACKKWGSAEALREVLRGREVSKYERTVERNRALFDESADTPGAASGAQRASKKRRLGELESLASIIRGDRQ